ERSVHDFSVWTRSSAYHFNQSVIKTVFTRRLRSFDILEREVRANMVYRVFTHVGAEKVPDAKTLARIERALGPEVFQKVHDRIVGIAGKESRRRAAKCGSTRRSRKPIFIIRPTAVCWAMACRC